MGYSKLQVPISKEDMARLWWGHLIDLVYLKLYSEGKHDTEDRIKMLHIFHEIALS